MKAQRRHELKANSLIWTLQGLPQTIKKYQSQISLVLVLIALAILMVRYRVNIAQQRLHEAQQSLGIATDELNMLKARYFVPGDDASQYMKMREEYFGDGLQQADDAYQKTPDSQASLKANALLMKGDLNFQMAGTPPLPGAATQPSLRPSEPADQLLSGAYDSYSQVLSDYPKLNFATTAARFGLAAVAENRAVLNGGSDASQWDAARAQYQAIIDSDAEAAYKAIATARLQLLPKLSAPVAIGYTAPAIRAVATQAAKLGPATAP